MSRVPLIFLIAGEASGDLLGAQLMESLKKHQNVRFAGIGGKAMTAQGLTSLFPMEDLSLLGIGAILRSLPLLLRRLRFTVKTIRALAPDAVITIDAPEFTSRVMKKLRALPQRPRLIHYVAPTVWALRPGRAKITATFLDHLLCLYPFEPPLFEKYGLPTTFVGHPLAQDPLLPEPRNPNLLCLLPGSRRSEIKRLLPLFVETFFLLKKKFPDLKAILPTLPHLEPLIRKLFPDLGPDIQIVVGEAEKKKAFSHSYLALAASGTVALQLAQVQLPCIIAYKIDVLSAFLARYLLKTPWVCMINILLRKPVVPECLQEKCTPSHLSSALTILLMDSRAYRYQQKSMEEAINLLKAPPDTAAKIILEEITPSPNK